MEIQSNFQVSLTEAEWKKIICKNKNTLKEFNIKSFLFLITQSDFNGFKFAGFKGKYL